MSRIHEIDRRRLVLALAALAAPVSASAAPCRPPRVLFVCPAGTVKSAIAREMLKQKAAAQGVAVVARSRGLHIEDHVSAALRANLNADGLDPAAEPARALIDADIQAADVVVAFDGAAEAPSLRTARRWRTPSWNDDYPSAKAALVPQIEALLVELAERPCRTSGAAP